MPSLFFFIVKKKNLLTKQLNRLFSIKNVEKALDAYNPDLIYYRQNVAFPGLINILKKYPVIMEANTNDLEEYKLLHPMKYFIYSKGRSKILQNISAIVAVSEEIELLYESLDIPKVVIANGYDFTHCPQNRFPRSGEGIQLIFVGSPDMPWHGVDHYLEMAELFPEYKFHLAGPLVSTDLSNVIQHGWLSKKELVKLYKKINIAVSTLALYRNSMNEASPLKSREYACYGLPMIVGYIDTDLDNEPYILNIGNTPDAVKKNPDKIKNFIEEWKDKSIDLEQVRHKVDYHIKEQKRLSFFEEIIQSSNSQNKVSM